MNEPTSLDAQFIAADWQGRSMHDRFVWRMTHQRTLERQTLGFMDTLERTMTAGMDLDELDRSIEHITARMRFLRQYAEACVGRRIDGARV